MSKDVDATDALVHLRVPASVKARWVRDSRTQGLKLTDWIVGRVERNMNIFKIPDRLADKYHGSGHALAATLNGQLVDLVYLTDALPDLDGDAQDPVSAEVLSDPRLGPTVRRLQTLGTVHVGMCSCWEFVEL